MGVPGNADLLLLKTAAAAGGYQVSRSLRFNSADSAFLNRTPGSAGNKKAWTWSGWVKRTNLGITNQSFFGSENGSNREAFLAFTSSDKLRFSDTGTGSSSYILDFETTQVFRDVSAWYHIVAVWDSNNATQADRARIYINGSRVTNFSTNTNSISSGADSYVNGTVQHFLGKYVNYSNVAVHGDFYLAETHFIDGQALDPTSFAETDATTGQWIPKLYSGSYGSQGWKLDFSDNSSNTATTLGKDTSGNGNNWTPNNLSVTAGAGNDSLTDTPTSYGTGNSGGDVRGNFATLNPLDRQSTNGVLSNGNLDLTQTSAAWAFYRATMGVSSGKWYWELTIGNNQYSSPCIVSSDYQMASNTGVWINGSANIWGYYPYDGKKYNNDSGTSYATADTSASGSVIGVALDMDAGTVTFYKNGTSLGQAYSGLTGKTIFPGAMLYNQSNADSYNFGQRAFAYTPPANHKALCDTNLTAPVIAKPSTVMDVKLYTGNGSTQNITGLGFSPDLVWLKSRGGTYGASNHRLYDTIRTATKALYSSTTDAESTESTGLTAFNSDGFSLGGDLGQNGSSTTFVAWCFDGGTSTVSNTQGSITSQVRANTSAGFSIVTFTSNASGNATVGHGLGVAPSLVILKNRTGGAGNWLVFHKAVCTKDNFLYLNSTNALGTYTDVQGAAIPSSTVFGINAGIGIAGSADCVAYVFSPVTGYSSFGSYVGNGSSDGVFVYTGFRVRWLMVKRTDDVNQWQILDAARSDYNVADDQLYANLSNAEAVTNDRAIDLLSNGFKLRGNNTGINASAGTYIYAAFAESPFQYARAR